MGVGLVLCREATPGVCSKCISLDAGATQDKGKGPHDISPNKARAAPSSHVGMAFGRFKGSFTFVA